MACLSLNSVEKSQLHWDPCPSVWCGQSSGPAVEMACCGGRPCGSYRAQSRYPAPIADRDPGNWKTAPQPAANQFAEVPIVECQENPPFTYSGKTLAACDFPLGGFGAGNVILRGDGTLQVCEDRKQACIVSVYPSSRQGRTVLNESSQASMHLVRAPIAAAGMDGREPVPRRRRRTRGRQVRNMDDGTHDGTGCAVIRAWQAPAGRHAVQLLRRQCHAQGGGSRA